MITGERKKYYFILSLLSETNMRSFNLLIQALLKLQIEVEDNSLEAEE